MIHFLRKLLSSDKIHLVPVAAIATAGSNLLYPNCNLDSGSPLNYSPNSTCNLPSLDFSSHHLSCRNSYFWIVPISETTLSVSLSWPQSIPLLWKFEKEGLLPTSSSFSFNDSQFRVQGLPLHFSSVNPVPSLDKQKETLAADNQKSSAQWIGRDTIANAAASVSPAVVNLSVTRGYWGIASGESIGSGTIIDKDGTILTCAHVVIDFQGTRPVSKGVVEVALQDGRTFKGTVLHADLHSDIAIVKIDSKSPLPSAKLGSSSKLRPGEWVLAVGCPLTLQNTVTAGIVSCVDRKSSDLGLGGTRREYLQTDCAINAGNSGGPLINIDGEIVGVNIMKVHAADGLSFAVPIDSVIKIMEQFKKRGLVRLFYPIRVFFSGQNDTLGEGILLDEHVKKRRVIRPWLGLKMVELNEMIVAQLKERDPAFPNVSKGVLIPMVTPGSPGDLAGFRPGDVVLEFDGNPVKNIKEIVEIMGDRVGEPLKVVVKRPNKSSPLTLTVTPEESDPNM